MNRYNLTTGVVDKIEWDEGAGVTRVWVKLPDHIRHLPIVCPEDCIHISTAKKKSRKSTSSQAQQGKNVPGPGGEPRAPRNGSWKESLSFKVSETLCDSAESPHESMAHRQSVPRAGGASPGSDWKGSIAFRVSQTRRDSDEQREFERAQQRETFAAADADGSGHLDFVKFVQMDINNGLSMAAKRRLFDSLDVDRSGKLAMEEFAMYAAAVKIQARHRGGRDRWVLGSVSSNGRSGDANLLHAFTGNKSKS